MEAFLRRQTNFARLPISDREVFDASFLTAQGDLRTLPSYWSERGGMDGFYAARLRRSS
jgi:16S rRNA (cytosine967-C5)-methyltransferase